MRPGLCRRVALLAVLAVAWTGAARAEAPAAFRQILDSYARALDGNDVETLVGLFGRDGVFMPEGLPPAAGAEALRATYRNIFATLKVGLRFTVQDGEQSGDLGWVRATSTGRVKVLATGVESAQSYAILVVFRREAGTWKIRNYLYAASK